MDLARRLVRLWFGFTAPVNRRAYAASGFGLMAFKYAVDAAAVWSVAGHVWTPLDYLSPLWSTRARLLEAPSGGWLPGALFVWTLPFVWIGASMTFRRVRDAGLWTGTGLLFFVPIANYLWMLLLCALPSRSAGAAEEPRPGADGPALPTAAAAAGLATALGVSVVVLSVQGLETYGVSLFFGTPFAMGLVAGFWLNRDVDRGAGWTLLVAQLALLLVAGTLLLFALEGVVCLVMAWPPAALLAGLGAVLGRLLASAQRLRPSRALGLLLVLPPLVGVEAAGPAAPVREVLSVVEIDAPPEVVWPRVVGFTELPPPHEWVFALGIAYPMRARIDGEGVGTTRRCEFSTGAFVEPVTAWEPPHRLAFDVASQPEPMHETSPYRHIRAPHLADGLRARRGEFRLVALPGGRTRLEGRTWYTLAMAPQLYWTLYSDALIHAIHQRVLAHVKTLAERDARAGFADGRRRADVPASTS